MGTPGEPDRARKREPEETGEAAILAAARAYTRRGWHVVPVIAGQKGIALARWQEMRLTEEELPRWFGHIGGVKSRLYHNLGILLGEPSGGLVDIDCDTPEAALAAADLLPPTGMLSGRAGNPASHYWYQVQGSVGAGDGGDPDALPATAKFVDAAAEPSGHLAHATHTMLVELRSTGCQTVAPPSLHPSGEVIRWDTYGEPGIVTGAALRVAVGQVAAMALLARHWPGEGQRDEAAKDLAGLLLRGGWGAEETDHFSMRMARIAGDEEWRKRGKAHGTAAKLAAGEPVTGGTSLAMRIPGGVAEGERVVALARRWLRLEGHGGLGSAQAATREQHAVTREYLLGMHTSDKSDRSEADDHEWLIDATDVTETAIQWLWHGRIPLGAITLLDGDPGLGKSLLSLDLAARVSTGRALPGDTVGLVGGAVLLSAEDDLAATIIPRLRMAAADLTRVGIVRGAATFDAATGQTVSRQFLLPQDIPFLERAIQRKAARLVVIDPLMAFLDISVNSWRDQDVRAALAPLASLAERTGAAILILRHLNKASGSSAIYRGGGSIGIIGAARSGLVVAKHPDDPDHERVLASTKSNLGPPMPSLRYRMVTPLAEIEGLEEDGSEHLANVPVVEWLGECDLSAATLLAGSQSDTLSPSKLEEAAQWLEEALADGPRPKSELERAALGVGISSGTLRRAREFLQLGVDRAGNGKSAHSLWFVRANEFTHEHAKQMLTSKEFTHECAKQILTSEVHEHECPVTGGAHDYAEMRDAQGHPICLACGEAAAGESGEAQR